MLKPLTSFGLLDDDDFLDNNCPLVLDIPEPNTLLPGEIEKARQAALEVIENHSADEALKIFLEDSLEIARDQNGGGGESELGNASDSGELGLQKFFKKDAHEGSKALTKAAAMKAIKQRMEKDAGEVQKIAHVIKAQIEELNRDNLANRQKPRCGKGSAVDHSRTATTFALKKKLKDKMAEFQVSSAVDHVLLKNTALQRAKTLQRNSVKWMCIAIIILLITVAVCHCCGCPKAMEN